MPEWGSLAWLVAAFAAVPVIWWLHWLRGPDAAMPVSALYLWRSQAVDQVRGAAVRRRADPRWRLRALIAACACLAASQLYWPDRVAPVSRVIQVGEATENVSVSHLAVRRSLRAPQTYVGSVAISNAGTSLATRRLRLSGEQGTFFDDAVNLAPGETALRAFNLSAVTGKRVEAALDAADVLPDDDSLVLESLPATFKVSVDSACGAAVRAVLAAHPALELQSTSGGDASLHVVCGTIPPAKQPALWLHKSTAATTVEPPVVWHENAGGLRKLNLSPAWLRRSARPPDGLDVSAAVLSSSDGPLVMYSPTQSGVLEVWLDMESARLVARPEYPALMGGLLGLVLDPSRLEGIATVSRPTSSHVVAPRRLTVSRSVDDPPVTASRLNLTPLLIVLTLALLLLDMRPVKHREPSAGPVG